MHRLYVLVFIVLSTAFGNYTAMREMKTNPVEKPGGKTPKTACRLLWDTEKLREWNTYTY